MNWVPLVSSVQYFIFNLECSSRVDYTLKQSSFFFVTHGSVISKLVVKICRDKWEVSSIKKIRECLINVAGNLVKTLFLNNQWILIQFLLVMSILGKDFVNLCLAFMDILLKKGKSISISEWPPSLIRTDAVT